MTTQSLIEDIIIIIIIIIILNTLECITPEG